jgi:hypothetical protein
MFKHLRRRAKVRPHAVGTISLPGTGLQVCAHCGADYVHPAQWHEAGDEHWWILLRCGQCGEEREVTIGDDVAKRYGEDLDAAQRQIDRAVQSLDRERMATETEIIVQALERDLIGADDFVLRGAPSDGGEIRPPGPTRGAN